MHRYIMAFSKQGFLRFTSHLDLMRLFKRAFKRTSIPISYSSGFNPHPKMSFAQPLSLGYTAKEELLEFHTDEELDIPDTLNRIRRAMPTDITIFYLRPLDIKPKSLASIVCGARYIIAYPIPYDEWADELKRGMDSYMEQNNIIAKKRQKKTKEYKDQDIRPMIKGLSLSSEHEGDIIALVADLDSGSDSNLSPDLLIETFNEFMQLKIKREDIQVSREYLYFRSVIPGNMGLHIDYDEICDI